MAERGIRVLVNPLDAQGVNERRSGRISRRSELVALAWRFDPCAPTPTLTPASRTTFALWTLATWLRVSLQWDQSFRSFGSPRGSEVEQRPTLRATWSP